MRIAGFLAGAALVLGTSICSASPAGAQPGEGFLVIVNISNPVSRLASSEISRLFLLQQRRWQDGIEAVPVDLSERSAVRAQFSKVVHGRSSRAVKAYWNQRVFLGRDTAPREAAGEEQVVAFVRDNRGAIGYVSASAHIEGVKVVGIARVGRQ